MMPGLGAPVESSKSIPTGPDTLPLLGHLVPLLRDPYSFVTAMAAHGDVVRIRVGPLKLVLVCDPVLTDRVLRNDRTFDKGGPIYDRAREVLGNGLSTCPHDLHRRQRRLVQPAFHRSRMPGYAKIMIDQTASVAGAWHNGQVLDVLAEMLTITGRIAAVTIFSDNLPTKTQHEVIEDFSTVVGGIYVRALLPPPLDRLPTPGNRRYHRANARLRRTVRGLIAERRATGVDTGDLLSALLSAHGLDARDDENLSDNEIIDQALSFYVAGTETTATTLAWALCLLGQHPAVQQSVHAEVDAVLAGRPATYADLPGLELTGRVVTETLRLRPPGWWLNRVATTDTTLGEYTVPKGTVVVYSPYLIQHRPDLYLEPEIFRPDRWISAPVSHPQRAEFIPFGGGARRCIGDHFSITEAVLALATILTRWQLEPVSTRPVRATRISVSARPKGLRMRLVDRALSPTRH
jgi:cytochrome P450